MNYIRDIMKLGSDNKFRLKLKLGHMETLIKAIKYQADRLNNSGSYRVPLKEEIIIGARTLILLQKLLEKKGEMDERYNRKSISEINKRKNK